MRMKLLAVIEPALSILALTSGVSAEVRPNSLFADNAVFQRGKQLPVWGIAREGERVTVEFGGQSVSTLAKDGKWKVLLVVWTPRTSR